MKRKAVAVVTILLGLLLMASGESDGPVIAVIGAVIGIIGFVMFFKGSKDPSQRDNTYMTDNDMSDNDGDFDSGDD